MGEELANMGTPVPSDGQVGAGDQSTRYVLATVGILGHGRYWPMDETHPVDHREVIRTGSDGGAGGGLH